MPEFRLSNRARADLREIAAYTFKNWGIEQARRYNLGLLRCFERIAASPSLGRPCDRLRKGYRRIEHGSHVVFYRAERDSVLISRILRRRMLPDLRLMDEE